MAFHCAFAVIAAASCFTAAPAMARGAAASCEIEEQVAGGMLAMAEAESGGDAAGELTFDFESDSMADAPSGHRYKFSISGGSAANPSLSDMPAIADNMMLILNIVSAAKTRGPSLLYITRSNYIPLDLAPAKLWYPEFEADGKPLEIATTMGDFERAMQLGPGENAVDHMGWITKSISQKAFDGELIDSGEIPLAPIWAARDAVKKALQGCLAAN